MDFTQHFDVSDIREPVVFFAVQGSYSQTTWTYHYGLSLRSTREAGSMGRCGDGDDFILAEGSLHVPEDVLASGDEESFLSSFAEANF